jgi:hypothetical protein
MIKNTPIPKGEPTLGAKYLIGGAMPPSVRDLEFEMPTLDAGRQWRAGVPRRSDH